MSLVIQKLRLRRGWSQQQLADLSGLSVRTVQRIESGQKATAESLKSLAAVFEVEFQELRAAAEEASPPPPVDDVPPPEPAKASPIMNTTFDHASPRDQRLAMSDEEVRAFRDVRKLRGFYLHLIQYVVIIGGLAIFDAFTSPGRWWVQWPAMGWGIGILAHGLGVWRGNRLFGPAWERQQIEKRLGRKLALVLGAGFAFAAAAPDVQALAMTAAATPGLAGIPGAREWNPESLKDAEAG